MWLRTDEGFELMDDGQMSYEFTNYACSECGRWYTEYNPYDEFAPVAKFCPHCGAKHTDTQYASGERQKREKLSNGLITIQRLLGVLGDTPFSEVELKEDALGALDDVIAGLAEIKKQQLAEFSVRHLPSAGSLLWEVSESFPAKLLPKAEQVSFKIECGLPTLTVPNGMDKAVEAALLKAAETSIYSNVALRYSGEFVSTGATVQVSPS